MNTFDLDTFSQEEEITHICDFLTKTWDVPSPEILRSIVSTVFTTGWNASAGRLEYCPKFLNLIESKYEVQKSLGLHIADDPLTDLLGSMLLPMMTEIRKLNSNLGRYETRIKTQIQVLKSHFDTKMLSSILPHNYKNMKKTYDFNQDDHYEQNYNDSEKPMYEGTTVKTHRAQEFSYRLATHDVVYNEVEQGYKPLTTLVGTLYSHGFSLRQLYNETLFDNSVTNMRLVDNILHVEDNPIIRKMLEHIIKTQEKFQNLKIEYLPNNQTGDEYASHT